MFKSKVLLPDLSIEFKLFAKSPPDFLHHGLISFILIIILEKFLHLFRKKKQCRHLADAASSGVLSGSALFVYDLSCCEKLFVIFSRLSMTQFLWIQLEVRLNSPAFT